MSIRLIPLYLYHTDRWYKKCQLAQQTANPQFKQLRKSSSFENLKMIGFNNYSDKEALILFKHVFFDKIVVETQALFEQGYYSIKDPYALVLHNNSNAFGQNIETEGPSSLNGVVGSYSDAAYHL